MLAPYAQLATIHQRSKQRQTTPPPPRGEIHNLQIEASLLFSSNSLMQNST